MNALLPKAQGKSTLMVFILGFIDLATPQFSHIALPRPRRQGDSLDTIRR
jgi:hypothetical protein